MPSVTSRDGVMASVYSLLATHLFLSELSEVSCSRWIRVRPLCMCVCVGGGWGGAQEIFYEMGKEFLEERKGSLSVELMCEKLGKQHGYGHRLPNSIATRSASPSDLPLAMSS